MENSEVASKAPTDASQWAEVRLALDRAQAQFEQVLRQMAFDHDQALRNVLLQNERYVRALETLLAQRIREVDWLKARLEAQGKIITERDKAIAWLRGEMEAQARIIAERDEAVTRLQAKLAIASSRTILKPPKNLLERITQKFMKLPAHTANDKPVATAEATAAPQSLAIATATKDAPVQSASGSVPEAIPLFLLGCPRSGTTLLARILNAHPAVLMTNETAVFLLLNDIVKKSRVGSDAGLLYGKEYHDLWSDHLFGSARFLLEAYFDKIRLAEGKGTLCYWGEKHPHHSDCLDFINMLYPQARYIYIVRDPRDSACSIASMNATSFSVALAIWKQISDAYEKFVAELSPERCLQVRYENLVADYEGVARQICEWLEVPYVAAVHESVTRHRHSDAHEPTDLAAQHDFRRKSVGRWRRQLSTADREFAVKFVREFLDRHGYELS